MLSREASALPFPVNGTAENTAHDLEAGKGRREGGEFSSTDGLGRLNFNRRQLLSRAGGCL